jgi:Asp/Glu/hydantoin racemase
VTSESEVVTDIDRRSLLLQAQACDLGLLERAAEQAARAIEDDHAEAIVLGCTCMSVLGAELADMLSVPVIDPEAAGVALAGSLALRHGPMTDRAGGAMGDVVMSDLVAGLGSLAGRLLA